MRRLAMGLTRIYKWRLNNRSASYAYHTDVEQVNVVSYFC